AAPAQPSTARRGGRARHDPREARARLSRSLASGMFCPHCGAQATPSTRFCAQCAESLVAPAAPASPERRGHTWMAWMIVGVCAVIIFAATSGGSSSGSGGSNAHSTATRATHCGIGDVRAVHDRKFGAIVAGSSKKALDDFGSAAVAHDTEGFDQMMNSGKLMELPNHDRL